MLPATAPTSRHPGLFMLRNSFPHYITQCPSYVTKVSRDFPWNRLGCLQSNAKLGAIHGPGLLHKAVSQCTASLLSKGLKLGLLHTFPSAKLTPATVVNRHQSSLKSPGEKKLHNKQKTPLLKQKTPSSYYLDVCSEIDTRVSVEGM